MTTAMHFLYLLIIALLISSRQRNRPQDVGLPNIEKCWSEPNITLSHIGSKEYQPEEGSEVYYN
jgi:sugar phosphate permease